MKRRITNEQIAELSNEQKQSLRDWWKPVYGDFFSNGHWENIVQSAEDDSIRCVSTDNDGAYDYESKNNCLPLLSIGQMIEWLQGSGNDWTLNGSTWDEPNICDRLWERLKHYL